MIAYELQKGFQNEELRRQLTGGPYFNNRAAQQFALVVSLAAYISGAKVEQPQLQEMPKPKAAHFAGAKPKNFPEPYMNHQRLMAALSNYVAANVQLNPIAPALNYDATSSAQAAHFAAAAMSTLDSIGLAVRAMVNRAYRRR